MEITQVIVRDLFGMFNHTIPLNKKERVTIIHSPNGYGKTYILKIIDSIIKGNLNRLRSIPFSSIVVQLSDDSSIKIKSSSLSKPPKKKAKLSIIHYDKDERMINDFSNTQIKGLVPSSILNYIDGRVPSPFHRTGDGWIDSANNYYTLNEILQMFPELSSLVPKGIEISPLKILPGINSTYIETDRLGMSKYQLMPMTEPDQYYEPLWKNRNMNDFNEVVQPVSRVERYSNEIIARIKSILSDYSNHSQEIDRTFPERLVSSIRESLRPLDVEELKRRMSSIEKKRQQLIQYGLLDSEKGLLNISDADLIELNQVLSIYVQDIEAKLSEFDNIADRMGVLLNIINKRFQYKTIQVNREKGFLIKPDVGDSIDISDLSSGEQHELVVLYELLFKTSTNSIVLVDEPEISLHVAWQTSFLEDFQQILKTTNSYGVIATHSPMIIGSHWDMTVQLEGPTKK